MTETGMERYYKRSVDLVVPQTEEQSQKDPAAKKKKNSSSNVESMNKDSQTQIINLSSLESDPGLRKTISDYPPSDHDEVRKRYILKGPCQPRNHIFPLTPFGKKNRWFNPSWFADHLNWLEYNINKDAAFCLCCYLFKEVIGRQDSFTGKGFSNWKKPERFKAHVGNSDSAHSYAWNKRNILMNQKQHIATFCNIQSSKDQVEYRIRLESSVDCI
ncbi:uncharacterized protein LOC141660386 [Apium graveolens]|uniref:uncharacterized protein LOC141660386 n=1 Tax=Apium graveolens TaxID=4045 RepID=UPI003D7A3E9D